MYIIICSLIHEDAAHSFTSLVFYAILKQLWISEVRFREYYYCILPREGELWLCKCVWSLPILISHCWARLSSQNERCVAYPHHAGCMLLGSIYLCELWLISVVLLSWPLKLHPVKSTRLREIWHHFCKGTRYTSIFMY